MFGFLSSEIWSGYPKFRIEFSVSQRGRISGFLVFFWVEQDSCDAKAEHGDKHGDALLHSEIRRISHGAEQMLACWKDRAPKHGHDGVYFLSLG